MPASALPAALAAISKDRGVLAALYDDLASPGVKQVGKALETVLKTGNIVLLPLRLLNEYAAAHERKNFEEIEKRFRSIPQEDVIDVRPEIGVPILERLSITHASELRRLFIELLASAADAKKVTSAHPNFVRVIESISPHEAEIISSWKGKTLVPCISISRRAGNNSSEKLYDIVYDAPVNEEDSSVLSAYISNMAGLGLITHRDDVWVADTTVYEGLVEHAKTTFPDIKERHIGRVLDPKDRLKEGDIYFSRECIQILSFGMLFQKCCLP